MHTDRIYHLRIVHCIFKSVRVLNLFCDIQDISTKKCTVFYNKIVIIMDHLMHFTYLSCDSKIQMSYYTFNIAWWFKKI